MGASVGTEVTNAGGVKQSGVGVTKNSISSWLQLGRGAGTAKKLSSSWPQLGDGAEALGTGDVRSWSRRC